MISLQALTKLYGDKRAVDGVDLEVADGEVCVLIGPSGSGKTTLLRMVNRLVKPSSGRVLIDGRDTSGLKAEELRRSLGYAIQSVGLFPHLTVAENIGTVPRLLRWDKGRIAARAEELLALVGLDPSEYGGKYPRQLSGGEAQRVGVARALAADPPALLMDEPFGAVDPLTRDRLQDEFLRIQHDLRKTVIFVTHDIDEAIRLADRIAILRDGRIVQHDTPESILEHPADKFVHDFVGADRALKRLVRVQVAEVMRDPSYVVPEDASSVQLAEAFAHDGRFAYVIDSSERLVGWYDRAQAPGDGMQSGLTRIDPSEAALQRDTSLKEALSRMLGLGFRSMPVVDDAGRLIGEITFGAVESVLGEGERDA